MAIVKVLVDAVGGYNAGDIVADAPDGLIEIAQKKVRNAATGELLAMIIEANEVISGEPTEREKELQLELEKFKEREAELLGQIANLQVEDDLKELKGTAKELKIPGYTKMSADELKEAIAAAGGEKNGE